MRDYLSLYERFHSKFDRGLLNNVIPVCLLINVILMIASIWWWYALIAAVVMDFALLLGVEILRRKLIRGLRGLRRTLAGFTHAGFVVTQTMQKIMARDFLEAERPEMSEEDMTEEAAQVTQLADDTMLSLMGIVNQLQELALSLGRASEEILRSSGEQATASSEQAASVSEITATMEELAKTAAQIARNSDDVAHVASSTRKASDEGYESVREVIGNVQTLKDKIDAIRENANHLGQQSREIGRILDLITDIANETHLLALNAAIESVAAGEYGRRFSVVAQEVRRLAERSSESVHDIRRLLEGFLDSINATVLSTEEGVKEVERTHVTADSAKENFLHIQEMVERTNSAVKEISIATQQQQTASEQVVMTLKEISKVSTEAAQSLSASSKAAESLNAQALSVQLFSQTFTIARENNLKYVMNQLSRNEAVFSMKKQEQEPHIRSFLARYPYFEAVYCANAQGSLLTFVLQSGFHYDLSQIMSGDYRDRPWFKSVMEKRSSWVTAPYESVLSSETCFTVATPILEGDRILGVLAGDVNSKQWNQIV